MSSPTSRPAYSLRRGRDSPKREKFYETAFGKVFEGEIFTTTVAKALAAYERTVNSFDSPFDRWLQGDDKVLTVTQKRGMLVFFGRGKCSKCHNAPHFTDSDFHNIGIPTAGFEKATQFPQNPGICKGVAPTVDPGRAEVPTLHASCADVGTFRTPTLRNVALSAPYMHNGKFDSLEAAVVHYEDLSQGTVTAVVGELDVDVRKGTILFGAGAGAADDVPSMVEFMKALTGSQLRGPKGAWPPQTRSETRHVRPALGKLADLTSMTLSSGSPVPAGLALLTAFSPQRPGAPFVGVRCGTGNTKRRGDERPIYSVGRGSRAAASWRRSISPRAHGTLFRK